MTLRVTQQDAEVLATGAGTLRVTQQNADVLAKGTGVLRVTQQDIEILTLAQNIIYVLDASSTLSLTETALVGGHFNKDAISVLTLTETTSPGLYRLSAESTLAMTQDASRNLWVLYTNSTLAITGTAEPHGTLHLFTATPLTLAQVARNLSRRAYAASDLSSLSSTVAYVGPRSVSAVSTLVLGSSGRVPLSISPSVISTLSLSQSLGYVGPVTVFAYNSLAFLDFADRSQKARQISDTSLVIQQTATLYKVYNAISTLEIEGRLEQGIINQAVTHQLQLVSNARVSGRVGIASSSLDLTHTARSSGISAAASSILASLTHLVGVKRPYYVQAINPLTYVDLVWNEETLLYDEIPGGLLQTATLAARSSHLAHQYLNWGSQAFVQHLKFDAIVLAASSAINLTTALFKNTTGATTSILQVNQSLTAWVGPDSIDTVDLEQEAICSLVRSSLATLTELILYQSVGYTKDEIGIQCNYHPFVGSSDAPGPLPPSDALPPMPGAAGVQFFWPYGGTPTATWSTTRKPEFGNKDQLMFQRINRETRGGRKIIFADAMWPKDSKMVMTFVALTETESQAYLAFVQSTLGLEIGFVDWLGRIFRGIITNIQDPMVRNGKADNSVTIEFEITTRTYPLVATGLLSLVGASEGVL